MYYNNFPVIRDSIKKVVKYCTQNIENYKWEITISINGPQPENIIELSKKLHEEFSQVKYLYTPTPGKGSGIKNAWKNSSANLLIYMDIDLSVDLEALNILISNLEEHDIVIGSRYHKNSKVKRNLKRKIISIIYHRIFHGLILGTKFSDAHCGFKGIKSEIAKILLPHIQDPGWFFDSEFLFLSKEMGYDIETIPIVWNDTDNPSGVVMKKVIPGFILKTLELKIRTLPYYIHKDNLTKEFEKK